jgi:hypothetical protein
MMIQLDIEEDDVGVLREVLASARSELGYEIANTDAYDYRQELKNRQALLARVLSQLES